MSHRRGQGKKKYTGQKIDYGRDINNKSNQRNNNTRGGGKGRGSGGGFDNKRDTPLPMLKVFPDIKKKKKGFRAIPIIPTEKELLAPQPRDIPVNKIDGPYESLDEYLETHYELLREDCLRPLRQGIQLLREKADEIPTLRIYEKVNLVGISFASIGIIHRISFTTRHNERFKWATSKRLIPGTLVVFSKDNFESMKFGTVYNRSLNLLEKAYDLQIDVLFQFEDIEFEWSDGYVMVETTSSYFEAYRHVMNVLQELDPDTLPFKEHIIEFDKEIDMPEYLEIRQSTYNFKIDDKDRLFDIKGEWPTVDKIFPDLHTSQYDALKRMLTRRLALIQGPPGTGKTYVGLKAVKILLDNLPYKIVITCQTNHALDQFLLGIQKFEDNIIRLGSRSKSDKIKTYTLYNKRQEIKLSDRPLKNSKINGLFRQKEQLTRDMVKLCDDIENPFLSWKDIEEMGCLSEQQMESLKQDDWFCSSNSNDSGVRDYIQEWLDPSISAATSKQNDRDFQISQLILQDGGNQTEDVDEVDEEDIQEAEADFHDNQFASDLQFAKLRSEKCIRSDTYVSEDTKNKYRDYEDLWEVPDEVRVALHNEWRRAKLDETCKKLKELCKKYFDVCEKIKNERIREDLFILNSARIIGMTTTAAAKYHKLLMNLEPKIMIIEEAAETLEAHIVTALTPETKHLILIGDHQQLRPNISVHELAEENKLNVSLFERLIKPLPFSRLTEQRRMRPEIRELLKPIYKDILTDHESVNRYPDVPGFYENLFFFDHIENEEVIKETMSRVNKFEAMMCAKFANYLVKGGMDYKKITILSMYSGQRKLIYKYLREDSRRTPDLKLICVSSVDGFQGEENDIIILSLVRSSDINRGIGFLGTSNRVCVALSRARHGLYIFGNASQLKYKSSLWSEVLGILEKSKYCGQSIDLYCQKHSNKEIGGRMVTTRVSSYEDVPLEGGCSRNCEEKMECGHMCRSICHISSHETMFCPEDCIRKLPCGHDCGKSCNEICGSLIVNNR
ncbi:DEAD box helicase [Rhizophagus clarus]|uniref:DEAD box helicase n=2 Tax=Rhizophagus clarus TaxID=94130 RepID=A0A8H3LD29_9GLOM|nr:DEAD box helicase [Rhizophagus clarus]